MADLASLVPVEIGDLGSCPSGMGIRLKQLIPLIEAALEKADGDNPYAVYKTEELKNILGSDAKSVHGFAACINRLMEESFKDKKIVAHGYLGNIRFDRVRGTRVEYVNR